MAMRMERRAIAEIQVSSERRSVDEDEVIRFAESMQSRGLLQPIGIRPDGTLVWGAHRLAAAGLLGWSEIDCVIVDVTDLDAALLELDENLIRAELSYAERVTALARRKEIYEVLHPETRHGANLKESERDDGGHTRCSQAGNTGDRPPSFLTDTKAKTKKSKSSVARDMRIGKAFSVAEIEHLRAAGLRLLDLDVLVSVQSDHHDLVLATLRAPQDELRDRFREMMLGLGYQDSARGFARQPRSMLAKRGTRHRPLTREEERQRNDALREESKKRGIPSGPTALTCQTERYSKLDAEREAGQKRTVTLDINPDQAARLLAQHFDKNEMGSFLIRLRLYLHPDTIRYVLDEYGKERKGNDGDRGLWVTPIV